MKRRTEFARLPAAAMLATALLFAACSSGAKLIGTPLGNTPAPDFTLRDRGGSPLSLHDLRGRAVVLTFLYTNCPDVCPAIAGKLAQVGISLGKGMAKVEFVAVSVDPTGDTPASVAQFTSDHGLDVFGERWHYGLGTLEELAGVWKAYGIGAEPQPAALNMLKSATGTPSPQTVDHNAVIYLLDRQGRERELLEWDVSPSDLTRQIRALTSN
jgi:protein SCO1/2